MISTTFCWLIMASFYLSVQYSHSKNGVFLDSSNYFRHSWESYSFCINGISNTTSKIPVTTTRSNWKLLWFENGKNVFCQKMPDQTVFNPYFAMLNNSREKQFVCRAKHHTHRQTVCVSQWNLSWRFFCWKCDLFHSLNPQKSHPNFNQNGNTKY